MLLSLGLGIDELRNWLEPGSQSQYNGLSDPFLLTCGRIESVPSTEKLSGVDRSDKNKTGPNQLTTPTPAYICLRAPPNPTAAT